MHPGLATTGGMPDSGRARATTSPEPGSGPHRSSFFFRDLKGLGRGFRDPLLSKDQAGSSQDRPERQATLEFDESTSEKALRDFLNECVDDPEEALGMQKLSKESLKEAQRLFERIIEEREVSKDELLQNLPAILEYKLRTVTKGKLIHFAVLCSARLQMRYPLDEVIKSMLNHNIPKEQIYMSAMEYENKSGTCKLVPIHLAAGLGSEYALEGLTQLFDSDDDLADYVTTYTKIVSQDGNEVNFYQPIHDTTYFGQGNATQWLVEKKANGNVANKDGMTPLAILAQRGLEGGQESDNQIRKVVKLLLASGAKLDEALPEMPFATELSRKIPLSIAAMDKSRFPKNLLYLLVPCFERMETAKELTFISDIAFVASLSNDAAMGVLNKLKRDSSTNQQVLRKLRLDAQKAPKHRVPLPDGSVCSQHNLTKTDLVSVILFKAAEAGGELLDFLLIEPETDDAAKNPIPCRTKSFEWWRYIDMRCAYRPDAKRKEGVSLPAWKFDPQKEWKDQPELFWQRELVPMPVKNVADEGFVANAFRAKVVTDLEVHACVLPNLLDMDLFLALARAGWEDLKAFKSVTVEGMISVMWNDLVGRMSWLVQLFQFVELLALLHLGISAASQSEVAESRYWKKGGFLLCLNLVAAGMGRDAFNLGHVILGFKRKRRGHKHPVLQTMWYPVNELSIVWIFVGCAMFFATAAFLLTWIMIGEVDQKPGGINQIWLAGNILMKAACLVYMLRLTIFGSRVHAITGSFFGGATKEMIGITLLMFFTFFMAFLVIISEQPVDETMAGWPMWTKTSWVMTSSYRSLIFGDGDGFDALGLNIGTGDYTSNNKLMGVFMYLGTFFFNIIILNLIIAIYGNEYDKVEELTPSLFLRERARYIVYHVLSANWSWYEPKMLKKVHLAALGCFLGGVLWTWIVQPAYLFGAVLFLVMELLLQVTFVQTDWYFQVEGFGVNKEPRFLFIAHSECSEEEETTKDDPNEARTQAMVDSVNSRVESVEKKLHVIERKLQPLGHLDSKLDAVLRKLESF